MADKVKKEKIFINAMDSWFSNFLIETFRTDHLPDSKLQTEIMGTINDKVNGRLPLYFEPQIVNFDYNPAYKSEIFSNDIFIYNLNTGTIKEINYILKGLKSIRLESEKIVILISNILTWAKTKDKMKTDNPDEVLFIHPDDIKPVEPPPKEEEKGQENTERNEGDAQNEQNQEKTQNTISEQKDKENKDEKKDEKKTQENNETNNQEGQKNPEENQVEGENPPLAEQDKANTNNKSEEEQKPQIVYYNENDYLQRKPLPKYIEFKYIENEALLLNNKNNIKAYVICPGIIYGYGEQTFYSLFRSALLGLPIEELLLDKGRNIVPAIHLKDLISIISKIIDKKPESYYLLAFDQSPNRTLYNLIKSIYNCIGDENKIVVPEEAEPEKEENKEDENPEDTANKEKEKDKDKDKEKDKTNENNPENNNGNEGENEGEDKDKKGENEEEKIEEKKIHPLFSNKKYILPKYFPRELLTLDLKILPSEFLKGEPKKSYYSDLSADSSEEKEKPIEYIPLFKWHAPQGIISNGQAIRKEFLKYRNLNPNRLLILGNPYTGKTDLSVILSKIFHLPIINSKMIYDYGRQLAEIKVDKEKENDSNAKGVRKNSIEKDLIRDLQKALKELDESKEKAEEEYNKRPNKKKTDPPFDDKLYYRFSDEMMVRILKRRLQDNDTFAYGYILDGFPKNYIQAQELFDDIEKSHIIPNSIIIFENVEDDFLINRLKAGKDFPKDPKDPNAVAILERANRRLGKVKETKNEEGFKEIIDFFKDEKYKEYFKVLSLDTKKEELDIVKECQEFIKANNEGKINQIDEGLDYHGNEYDYVAIEEERIKKEQEELAQAEEAKKDEGKKDSKKEDPNKKQKIEDNTNDKNNKDNASKKEETARDNEEENKKSQNITVKEGEEEEGAVPAEKSGEIKQDSKDLEEKPPTPKPKTQLEIEEENEFKLLEKKSEVLRRYLAENVLPLLSLGILHVVNERPDDPVEALADYLLAKTFELEKNKVGEVDKNNAEEGKPSDTNINENKIQNLNNEQNEQTKEENQKNLDDVFKRPLSPIEKDPNAQAGNAEEELNKAILETED